MLYQSGTIIFPFSVLLKHKWSMHTDFLVHAKCTMFQLNRGVRVYLEVYVLTFHKKDLFFSEKDTLLCSSWSHAIYPLWYLSSQRHFFLIWHIQINVYPTTYIEPKYCAFYSNNKVTVHGLVLLVKLSQINLSLLSRGWSPIPGDCSDLDLGRTHWDI